MENVNTYSKKERNMFLTGMFGQNMIYNVVTVGLYYYFQNVICLPAIAFGWIFAIASRSRGPCRQKAAPGTGTARRLHQDRGKARLQAGGGRR